MKELKLVLDKSVVDRYCDYYFSQHTRAKKKPITEPIHPSINKWCILPRISMNALKQKHKDFIMWWINDLGYANMQLSDFSIHYKIYFDSKRRHDTDNYVAKFWHDAFTESGFIVDDDSNHMHSLTMECGYDKENPRTEITITIHD